MVGRIVIKIEAKPKSILTSKSFLKTSSKIFESTSKVIATLALGSGPKQRLAKVRANNEAREPHFM